MSIETREALTGAARTIETIGVQIGSVRVLIDVDPPLAARLRKRYLEFVVPHPGADVSPRMRLTSLVHGGTHGSRALAFVPRLRLEVLDDDRIRVVGDCQASLDLSAGSGVLEAGDGFTGMDSLVRLSLSLLTPADGWILFHGAAVELASGGWALLLGRSGAGKSTAARAFVSYCDEMVLARPEGGGAEAASTPYWNGRPRRAPCRVVVCLERSEAPALTTLTGCEAIRSLSAHVVRYVPRDAADRTLFERLCAVAARVPVVLVRSASGDSYPTSLGHALESSGFAPRWNAAPRLQGGLS